MGKLELKISIAENWDSSSKSRTDSMSGSACPQITWPQNARTRVKALPLSLLLQHSHMFDIDVLLLHFNMHIRKGPTESCSLDWSAAVLVVQALTLMAGQLILPSQNLSSTSVVGVRSHTLVVAMNVVCKVRCSFSCSITGCL